MCNSDNGLFESFPSRLVYFLVYLLFIQENQEPTVISFLNLVTEMS